MTAKTKNPLDQVTYEADCSAERIEMTPDLKELTRRLRETPPNVLKEREAAAAILSLIAELARANKDAERYQWLRKSHHDDASAIGVTRERMNGWGRVVGKSLRNSDLDKAIDAAIAKEQS